VTLMGSWGHVTDRLLDLVALDRVDQTARGIYIRLGCYLLDKSFVFNSNSISYISYSFISNELYFQV
jgi:hypothetical protein